MKENKKDDKFLFVVNLLREFYYEKNGKEDTIGFLKEMIKLLEEEQNIKIISLLNEGKNE